MWHENQLRKHFPHKALIAFEFAKRNFLLWIICIQLCDWSTWERCFFCTVKTFLCNGNGSKRKEREHFPFSFSIQSTSTYLTWDVVCLNETFSRKREIIILIFLHFGFDSLENRFSLLTWPFRLSLMYFVVKVLYLRSTLQKWFLLPKFIHFDVDFLVIHKKPN